MTGRQTVQQGVAQQGAWWVAPANVTPIPGWKPSRYFEEWKKEVGETRGYLAMTYMQFCDGLPPDARKQAIESILRQTMPCVYKSIPNNAAFAAMDNDIYAMWEYATRFFDEFWKEFCDQFWQSATGPEWDRLRPSS